MTKLVVKIRDPRNNVSYLTRMVDGRVYLASSSGTALALSNVCAKDAIEFQMEIERCTTEEQMVVVARKHIYGHYTAELLPEDLRAKPAAKPAARKGRALDLTLPAPKKWYVATYGPMGLEVNFYTDPHEHDAAVAEAEEQHGMDRIDSYTHGEVD